MFFFSGGQRVGLRRGHQSENDVTLALSFDSDHEEKNTADRLVRKKERKGFEERAWGGLEHC